MSSPSHITPWYKQFWPWFLIAVPLSSFIVGFIVVHFATNTTDSLVIDDYYKEGRSINLNIDKTLKAKSLRITTDLTIDDGNIALKFHSGIPKEGNALKLAFYHVTLSDRDITLLLSRDANGIYRGHTDANLAGKWQVTLSPVDDSWKIQNVIFLPFAGAFKFNPPQ
jgi:hypothetical protein